MSEESDEDWDKDLGLGESDDSSPILSVKLQVGNQQDKERLNVFPEQQTSTLFEDWDKDLDLSTDFNDDSQQTKPTLVITGIQADPLAKEDDWDGDFDFGDSASEGNERSSKSLDILTTKSKLSTKLDLRTNKVRSGSQANNARAIMTLKELINNFPNLELMPKTMKKLDLRVVDLTSGYDKIQESKAIWELGLVKYEEKNWSDALKLFRGAQDFLGAVDPKEKDLQFECLLLFNMGICAASLGNSLNAINYFKQSLELLDTQKPTHNNIMVKASINHHLGKCYISTENFAVALQHFAESLKAAILNPEEGMDWTEVEQSCLAVAKCCKKLQLFEFIKDFSKKTADIATKLEDPKTAATAEMMLKALPDIEEKSETSLSGEEENWDEEFGIEDQRQNLVLPGGMGLNLNFGNQTTKATSELQSKSKDLIPSRYRFIESARRDVEIVRYPKATFFYSMKSKEHRLTEEELGTWLNNIVSKHTQHIRYSKQELINKPSLELKQQFISYLQSVPKYSNDWVIANLEYCNKLIVMERVDSLWETLFDFFLDVKDCKVNDYVFTSLVIEMVFLAAKMWKEEEDENFMQALTAVKLHNPDTSDLMEIIRVETLAHHKFATLTKNALSYMEVLSNVYTKLENIESSKTPAPQDKQSYFEWGTNEVKARALCDIDLLLFDASPLTTLQRSSDVEDDEDDTEHKQYTGSTERNLKLEHMSALIDATSRYEKLRELYILLGPSITKAKVAYVLGYHAAFYINNNQIAEQLFFESIYILDMCKSPVEGLAPIVSELGANALVSYGDTLLRNYKYQYAVAAFQSAINNFKLRKKGNYFILLNRLATITKENDSRKSIDYFKEVLDKYLQDPGKKVNEIRFVSETISGLYLSLGDFRKAEIYLQKALGTLKTNHSSEKIDPESFRLQMKGVDLFLDSYRYERGIEILQSLMRSILPHGVRPNVLAKLAKAYIKKRWFRECFDYLKPLEKELTTTKPDGNTLQRTNSENDKKQLKYWELLCLNYFRSGQFIQALHCVDMALSICPPKNLSSMGHYYYLRGKIFQAFCNSSISLQFPIYVKSQEEKLKSSVNQTPTNQTKYTCSGDLLQECIISYDKAYNYFRVLGDDVKIAKTVCNIAQTYLERMFCPVAFLHVPFQELAKFPLFVPVAKEKEEIAKQSPKHSRKHSRSVSLGSEKDKTGIFEITYDKIENPAVCALDICADTFNIWLISKCYLNMAELKFLKGEPETALAYWSECRDQLMTLFTDSSVFLGKSSPPNFLKKIYEQFKRLTRMLFCFETEIINRNLSVIDTFLFLEQDLAQSQKRPVQTMVKSDHTEKDLDQKSKSLSFGRTNKKPPSLGRPPSWPPSQQQRNNGKNTNNRPSATSVFQESSGDLDSTSRNSIEKEDSEAEKYIQVVSVWEESAERIWGFLYAIRSNIQSYSKGKLTQEELVEKNKKILKKILSVKRAAENIKQNIYNGTPLSSLKEQMNRTGSSPRISISQGWEELLQNHKDLSKLVLLLQMDNLFVYYVPSTGQKRIQHLGRKEESANINPAQTTLVNLNIRFLSDPNECVSLLVSPNLTLDKILKYLCNTAYWENDDSKKRTFFGSFGKSNQTPVHKNKPKFLDRSKEFQSRLLLLLNLMGLSSPINDIGQESPKSKKLTSAQLSLISFAKKVTSSEFGSMEFQAMTVATHTTVQQCFSHVEIKQASAEHPLVFYIYLSTNNVIDIQPSSMSQSKDLKTIFLSKDILHYLASLVSKDNQEDNGNVKKIIVDMVETVFNTLLDIIPYTEKGGYMPSLDKSVSGKVSKIPLSIVCSSTLQIFPWELMLDETVVRYCSLMDMLEHAIRQKQLNKPQEIVFPKYFSCVVSAGDKNLMTTEDERRKWLIKETFYNLNVGLEKQIPSAIRFAHIIGPFHSPLVKYGKRVTAYKRQFKLITWIDTCIIEHPLDLAKLMNSQYNLGIYPVFFLTYADLLELAEPLTYLMRSHPNCTFIFIPSSKIKQAVTKLLKYQEEAQSKKKTELSIYYFLLSTLGILQSELAVPIAIFNPPRDVI